MRNTSLRRRSLLVAAAAGATLAACDSPAVPGTAIPQPSLEQLPFDPHDWASVRAQFALDPALSHFAAFVFASPPATVRNGIALHRAAFDHNAIEYLHANEGRYQTSIRIAAASYLGTRADEIAFTDSTTMGLGLVYSGLRLKPGEEILTTEHDFYSTHESLRLRTARDGVAVRRVRLYADPARASVDEIVSGIEKALTPATKVVAMTWVHSGTGVKLPVREIANAVKGKALLCLDSVHGFGAEDAGPPELGVDFLISGCHKWLFGPRGTGLIWGSPAGWSAWGQTIPTFTNDNSPGGYKAFEHLWALTEAFNFHRDIGRGRIADRVHALNTRLKDGLAGIKDIKLITPRSPDLSAGIVCFLAGSQEPSRTVQRLRTAGVVASVTPYDPPYVRLGASIATMESDVDRALKALSG
jgi:selenocysteine lyase/cysteine desulfurase